MLSSVDFCRLELLLLRTSSMAYLAVAINRIRRWTSSLIIRFHTPPAIGSWYLLQPRFITGSGPAGKVAGLRIMSLFK